jgi:Flp pilus assembly protein TadD
MDRAFRNAPDAPDLFDLRAWFHEGRGNFAAAEADLRHAIALNPYSARLRERLALLLQTMGRRDEALAMQREAIALHPLDPEHWMTLAEMLAGGGRLDEARAALRETFGLLLISESEQQRRRRIAAALSVELPAEESR